MRRVFACAASLLLALGTLAHAGTAPVPRSQTLTPSYIATADYCAESEELAFLTLINNYRKQYGLAPLVMTQTLGAAAEHHSVSMATHGYFSHTLEPEGISWRQNMTNHGYGFNTYAGENLAAGNETAHATFLQWKNSPTHDANMRSAHYTAIGIGRAYNAGSTYKWYWTTDFGGYVDGAAKLCGATTSSAPSTASGTPYKIVRSGRTSNSYSSIYAYDANARTAWITYWSSTPPRYAYVWFDLGHVKPVGSVRWQFLVGYYADSVKVQVSADGRTWTTLGRISNPPAGTWRSLSTSTNARYVRFYFANPNKDPRLGGLAEVKITS